jgi:hypothetical protein
MSAPGALARRFWGAASVHRMLATSLRKHSPPSTIARHGTLRPQWRWRQQRCREDCVLFVFWWFSDRVEVQRRCCQPAALQGASRPHMICPQHRCAITHRTLRRAMTSASAKMPRRRFFWGFLCLSVGPCPDFLTTNAHTSNGSSSSDSYARVRCRHI